ncbi:hypothetical protein ACQ86N_07690 [Puia sp. P3]|uniref:hypothetical protein n=1 Tax=Puia sp. P3 TaxID=3423952 RepID=UPI003D67DFCA
MTTATLPRTSPRQKPDTERWPTPSTPQAAPSVWASVNGATDNSWLWAAEAGGTVWRTTGDVRDKWKAKPGEEGMGILNIVDINGGLDRFAQKGHWNDPDMLVVGLYGKKAPPPTSAESAATTRNTKASSAYTV